MGALICDGDSGGFGGYLAILVGLFDRYADYRIFSHV